MLRVLEEHLKNMILASGCPNSTRSARFGGLHGGFVHAVMASAPIWRQRWRFLNAARSMRWYVDTIKGCKMPKATIVMWSFLLWLVVSTVSGRLSRACLCTWTSTSLASACTAATVRHEGCDEPRWAKTKFVQVDKLNGLFASASSCLIGVVGCCPAKL